MLLLSVVTLWSFVKYLLNVYSTLGSVVDVEDRAQNTTGKVFSETYIVKGADIVHK